MQAYERIQLARANSRPTAIQMIGQIVDDFMQLHGDRLFADDGAIIGGIATLKGVPVTVIGIEKGRNTDEKIHRNFGSAHPEGYRKALRLMRQAEKFKRPVICIVDTSGAYCGIGAEERGQGSAIAMNLMEMMDLQTPIFSIVLGEGGSGGALALAVANEVWMLENAVYSVISAEGAASILYKDASKAKQAAQDLKMTAQDLLSLGVIERIFEEHAGDFNRCFSQIQEALIQAVEKYAKMGGAQLAAHRYQKFRNIGREAE